MPKSSVSITASLVLSAAFMLSAGAFAAQLPGGAGIQQTVRDCLKTRDASKATQFQPQGPWQIEPECTGLINLGATFEPEENGGVGQTGTIADGEGNLIPFVAAVSQGMDADEYSLKVKGQRLDGVDDNLVDTLDLLHHVYAE